MKPNDRPACRWCLRPMDEGRGESFFGPRGWVRHWYCCGHGKEFSCPDCCREHAARREFAACPGCKCTTQYA